jgi:hypothetical protein
MTLWTWAYSGPGSGAAKTDGNNLYWDVAGAAARVIRAHHNTPLASNMQMSSLVQTAPKNGSNTDPELRLLLRSDAAINNYLMANWTHNAAAIGYVVAGAYTQVGASAAHSATNGARWEFRAGTTADDYQLQLYLNDSILIDVTDSSHASVIGASNLYAGLGMLAGVTFDAFGFHQIPPPKIQGWAAADR